jgi:cobalt-zinc-cadmium efflux system outer membrane protein
MWNDRVRRLAVVAVALSMPACVLAQAGGAGAGGAAGTGSSASAPGATSAGQGAAAGAQGSPGAQAQGQNGQTPQDYAAGATLNVDPRTKSPAKPGALTLEQVVELAKTKNPTLLAAEANLRSIKAQELQAAVRQNPLFTLYGTNITLPAEGASNPYAYSAQVSRLFERGGKRGIRIEDAKATTAQTGAQLEDTIRQTLLTVKTAFTTMLIAKQAMLLSQANLKEFGHEVDIANDRFKAGDLAKIDFERLDLQLGDFESGEANDIITLQQASQRDEGSVDAGCPGEPAGLCGVAIWRAGGGCGLQAGEGQRHDRPDARRRV